MNERNVASFESSKKLVDNGIVLDTECYWCRLHDWDKYELKSADYASFCDDSYPAPCFTEVWRELPFQSYIKMLDDGSSIAWICDEERDLISHECWSTNPTDALIELLVWVKQQNRERIIEKLVYHADKLKW